MGKIQWNESQRAAIDFRGKNLLLSAAAGSGKTATLTQRIIELLCDSESEAEISSMLVLTFTRDAAAELKSRISAALSEAIARDPADKRLLRQLRDLDGAAISTTHSFLINELKPHFMRFDLPPDFSICDDASVKELRRELMADTVSDFFEGVCHTDDLILLADALSGAKDDQSLDETLLKLWEDLLLLGLDTDFLRREEEEGDFLLSGVGCAVAERMRMISEYYERLFTYYAEELAMDEATAKNSEVAMKTAEIARQLGAVSHEGYLKAKVLLSDTKLPSNKSVKSEDSTREYEEYSALKKKFSDALKKLYERYFSLSLDALNEAAEKTRRISAAAADVIDEYERRFAEAKRERGKIDFNDAERFALKLFCNPDGSPTPEALEVAKKYTHIFIDEYQDTNRIQDMLYTVFSHAGSRFMVGDVKQAIYRFRGARPENFVKYRREYESGGDGTAIFMSENHRSDSGVIEFSNIVSDYMFPFSDTPFEDADRLVCAKQGGSGGAPCSVVLVEEGELTEADYVADRIKKMIGHDCLANGELIRPRDIAIIMRTGKLASLYKKKLEERGIAVNNGAAENYFDHSEVLLLLSLLCAIDNPTSDVYLAAVMKSPLFGFTLDDMISFRGGDKVPLWYSVRRYAEENSDGLALRLRAFAGKMDSYREMAGDMLCDKFLYYLITDTGFNSLRDDSGNGRLIRSVRKMYSLALGCAESGGGLHDLIVYLKGLMKGKESSDSASDSDAVTIISTHRSKGLEYPVCFICDVAKQFNTDDTKKNAMIDPENGLFTRLPDPGGIVRCDTPHRNAAVLASLDFLRQEEMRVLYVALTRAREQLIVTLRTKDAAKYLEASAKRVFMGHNEYAVKSVDSAGMWILDAVMLKGGDSSFTFESVKADDMAMDDGEDGSAGLDGELISQYEEQMKARFAFKYDRYHLADIPAKLPVSKLSSHVLDTGYDTEKSAPPMPSFMAGERKISAAERGTATHMLLQFCDLASLKNGSRAEAERLCRLGFISSEALEMIRYDEVDAFAKGSLCRDMLSAAEIYREVRFNHMLDASLFTEKAELKEKLASDETKICVQGVVDCLFIDSEGKAVLVDYKTDRLSPEEMQVKALAAKKLISRHGDQLYTYRDMCAEMLGRDIDRLLIYSLALGDIIELT